MDESQIIAMREDTRRFAFDRYEDPGSGQKTATIEISTNEAVDAYHGLYRTGPFRGRPIAHPYNTVLTRLSWMGVNPPSRQFDETDKAYVVRLSRTYMGLFKDVVSSGVLEQLP